MQKLVSATFQGLFAICLLTQFSGCGASNSNTFKFTGRAIHETIGGAVGLPPIDTVLARTPLTFHLSGTTVEAARTQTDPNGNFAVSLPAGSYQVDLLDRDHQPLYNIVSPSDLVVFSNNTAPVEIKFVQQVP